MAQNKPWQWILGVLRSVGILFISSSSFAVDLEFSRDVQPLLTKYCVGCHNPKEAEGGFVCDHYDGLMKGSKDHVVVNAGSSEKSDLLKFILGSKEPKMPPEDELQLTEAEIATIRQWIDQGARRDERLPALRDRLKVATVASKHGKPSEITAMHLLDGERLVALGSYSRVNFYDLSTLNTLKTFTEVVGKVTSIRPSSDGQLVIIGSGVTGVGGQISILDVAAQKVVRQFEGHRDTIYSAVISPDGSMIASAGYDRRIILWDTATGEVVRHLDGHNGPIYDLDFHPSGQILASCSGDETTKIWHVASGVRLDTLSQGEAEQYSVRFTPDGNRVMVAGADRRVRIWKLISRQREAINPMLHSCFAHEKAILVLRISPDGKTVLTASEDRTVKLWTSNDLTAIGEAGRVSDVPTDAAWRKDSKEITVATVDGRVESYSVEQLLAEFSQRSKKLEVESNPSDAQRTSLTMTLDELAAANSKMSKADEVEPNNSIDLAMTMNLPGEVAGKISSNDPASIDEDWFCIQAERGQPWVIAASAVKPDSQLDPMIEIRDSAGEPIVRTRLQAVRESYFTFRGKDSSTSDDFRVHRWEDMELNEFLYSGGEVVKLWLYPRGPDSGFKVYPGSGKRRTYFDTTANSHALGEPAWIVRELAGNESPSPNGLPTFPVYFENDDDATRRVGKDSRLIFTAPEDGRYFIRLRDSRQLQNDTYSYKLSVRRRMFDYTISSPTKNIDIVPGAGGEFSVNVERTDDFEGPVELRIEGLPANVVASQPLNIEAGQELALGSIFVAKDANDVPESFTIEIIATAQIEGQSVERKLPASIPVKLSKKPNVLARFAKSKDEHSDDVTELVIRPGETISTFVLVERGEEKGDIPFGKDDSGRNLPHGVFVSNIGLSGLVVKPGENSREVFITASPGVQPTTRPFHLKTTLKGMPTTRPILLRVETP